MATLQLPAAFRTSLEGWARASYPQEGCGLLIGKRGWRDCVIKRVTQAKNLNLARARDRYLLDPQDFLEADRVAREENMEVLGVWHSHPDHPALPSETDRAAAWPDWAYVILAVTGDGVQDLRAWRLNECQTFDEEVIQS
jgi:proteasome lid subunit RPN8/RPN11